MSRGAKWHQGRVTPSMPTVIQKERKGKKNESGVGRKSGVGKAKEGRGCAWRET